MLPYWSEATILCAKLYILSFLLQAVGLGLLCMRLSLFGKSKPANVAFGAAMTPFVQFVFTFLLLLLPWKLPFALYVIPLPAVALIWLCLQAYTAVKRFKYKTWKALLPNKQYLKQTGLTALAVVMVLVVCLQMLPGLRALATQNYSVRNDNAEYITKAIWLADTQVLSRPFLSVEDEPAGHFLRDYHFPSYTPYLTYALMHTPAYAGYPYDMPGQCATLLIGFYLFLAYIGALFSLCDDNKKWIPAGILLFFLIPRIGYPILYASARDGFRCLGLLCLFGYLLTLRAGEDEKAFSVRDGFGVALFSFLASSTHVIAIAIAGLLLLSWALANLRQNQRQLDGGVLRLFAFGLLGCLIGAYPILLTQLPKLVGGGTSGAAPTVSAQAGMSLGEKIKTAFFFMEGPFLPLWAGLLIVVLLLFLFYAVRRKQGKLSRHVRTTVEAQRYVLRFMGVFIGLLLVGWIPFTNILNGLHSFSSGGFIRHSRYSLQNLLFSTLFIVYVLTIVDRALFYSKRQTLSRILSFCAAALFFASIVGNVFLGKYTEANLVAYANIAITDPQYAGDIYAKPEYAPILALSRDLAKDEKLVVTSQGLLYPHNGKAYVVETAAMAPLTCAATAEAAEEALKSLSVAAIVTLDSKWEGGYDDTPLGQYIAASPYVVAEVLTEPGITIYHIAIPE